MENFVKMLEEESDNVNRSLKKIEEEVENLYHNDHVHANTNEEAHIALKILEEISDTETALDEMLDQVERENSYLTQKTEETRADLKIMVDLVNDIEKSLGGNDKYKEDIKTEEPPKQETLNLVDLDAILQKPLVLPSYKQETVENKNNFIKMEEDNLRSSNTSLDDLEKEVDNLYRNRNCSTNQTSFNG